MTIDNDDARATGQTVPTIRRGILGELTIYEVTDDELAVIERGSPDSLWLNFGLFLLSTFLSFAATLLTVEITDNRIFYSFLIVCCVSAVASAVLLAIWRQSARNRGEIFRRIRARLRVGSRKDTGGAEDSGLS